jgi:hypothetical protein
MAPIVRRSFGFLVAFNVIFTLLLLVLKKIIPSVGDEQSDLFALSTIMDGLELTSQAQAFRGGSVLTLAGGSAIDLRKATLSPDGALLKLNTIMGGTALLVPESWRVEVKGPAVMGAIEDRTADPAQVADDGAPMLVVEALAVMGGIDIASKPLKADGEPRPELSPVV